MAINITVPDTAKPTQASIIFCSVVPIVPSLKVVNRVEVRVSIDTQAAAKLIAFDAEKTGLLYFLYLTTFTMATVKAVNVYAAMAIAVIM